MKLTHSWSFAHTFYRFFPFHYIPFIVKQIPSFCRNKIYRYWISLILSRLKGLIPFLFISSPIKYKSLNTWYISTYSETCQIYYPQNVMEKMPKKTYQKMFYINYFLMKYKMGKINWQRVRFPVKISFTENF